MPLFFIFHYYIDKIINEAFFSLTFSSFSILLCFSFNFILSKIQHRIQKEYQLGRGDYLYTIAEMVDLAESAVCQIVVEVCKAIWSEAVDRHFPKSDEDFKEKMLGMDAEWQFPYAFSGIDGSHLPIKFPNGRQEAIKQH